MLETLSEPAIVRNTKSDISNMGTDILPISIVVCADQNLSCDLQGEAVVLNLESGTYFGLNPLGARIWELVQKPAKVSFVRDELLKEYNVDPSQCEVDLLSFLRQLHAHGLIRIQGSEDIETLTSPA